MFKWFGLDSGGNKAEDASANDDHNAVNAEKDKTEANAEPAESDTGPKSQTSATGLQSVSGALGLLSTFASAASKTAHRLKESVDEKLEQTIIGDFQRENEKFVKERHSKRTEDPVPPWVGYNEEEEIKAQILALSSDERNFLRDPPSGVDFHFDLDGIMPIALTILSEDPKLQNMRFNLVPKKVKEEKFWRNYFYRVSLIKQSSQLSTLAQTEKRNSNSQDSKRSSQGDMEKSISEASKESTKGTSQDGNEKSRSDNPSNSAPDKDISNSREETDSADWEKELQDELQDFEFVSEDQGDSQEPNPEWEREIEDMLGLDEEENQQTIS